MSLGSKINEIRKRKGLSIDELCELSGIPKGTLSKITAGITTSPTLDTVRAIANALGCKLDDLDDSQDTKKSPSEAEAAPGEDRISMEESNRLLVALGLIEEGQDLSDDDLAFLGNVIALLETWFRKGNSK